jgi:hypothetical protein
MPPLYPQSQGTSASALNSVTRAKASVPGVSPLRPSSVYQNPDGSPPTFLSATPHHRGLRLGLFATPTCF